MKFVPSSGKLIIALNNLDRPFPFSTLHYIRAQWYLVNEPFNFFVLRPDLKTNISMEH